jgi:hypothetical protein
VGYGRGVDEWTNDRWETRMMKMKVKDTERESSDELNVQWDLSLQKQEMREQHGRELRRELVGRPWERVEHECRDR